VTTYIDDVVDATDLPELATASSEDLAFFEQLGIETVAVSSLSETELAAAAVRRLVDERGTAADVGALLLVGGRAPSFLLASEATRLQSLTGLDGVFTFAVTDLGCTSMSAALLTAAALVEAGRVRGAVIVAYGASLVSTSRLRVPVTLNGDAGVACVVSMDASIEIERLELETSGEYWDLCRVDYRGGDPVAWREQIRNLRTYSFQLPLEGRKRFRTMQTRGAAFVDTDGAAPRHVVMQNLSAHAFEFYERALELRIAECCRQNLREYGHLGSADILVNLERGCRSGEFQKGDRMLALDSSPAAAWGSMVVKL
jgi:3-oxoacyl-[acyl-carrier-protein] synthase-3